MNAKTGQLDTQDAFFPKHLPIDKVKKLEDASAREMNTTACVRFVEVQIIREAIQDYKMLEKRGLVKKGKMIRGPRNKKEVLNYPNKHSVEHLLCWFQNKKDLAFWLDSAQIRLAPEAILKGLGFPC